MSVVDTNIISYFARGNRNYKSAEGESEWLKRILMLLVIGQR
jgi:hypothetical protein